MARKKAEFHYRFVWGVERALVAVQPMLDLEQGWI